MTTAQIIPVILSGGSGSRLWPVSRRLLPKQLLPLVGERTMLQQTALRVRAENLFAAPVVVCNVEHRLVIAEQLLAAGVKPHSIMLEPEPKNTAPATVLAALLIAEDDEDALMLVLPADHQISDQAAFLQVVECGAKAAGQGLLVTFGIVPDSPRTGYGYIRRGLPLEGAQGAFRVDAFVEKPDQDRAQEYVEAGDYFWNSGMFLMSARMFLQEAEAFIPSIVEACRRAVRDRRRELDFECIDAEAFARAPAISIDYGVMEKSQHAAIVPADMGWSDVGTWASLWAIGDKDTEGNLLRGDVIARDVKNSLLRADGAAIAALGVEDILIVTTKDMVLVCSLERSEEVKDIVEDLNAGEHDEHAVF